MQIYVDEIGLHYVHRDGSKTSFFYDKFQKTNVLAFSDVFRKVVRSGKYAAYKICFFYPDEKGNVRQEVFHTQADTLFAYIFARNKAELRAFFIKNIAKHRPDLQIDTDIFKYYAIDEKTFVFDKAKRNKNNTLLIIKALILTSVFFFLVVILIMFLND